VAVIESEIEKKKHNVTLTTTRRPLTGDNRTLARAGPPAAAISGPAGTVPGRRRSDLGMFKLTIPGRWPCKFKFADGHVRALTGNENRSPILEIMSLRLLCPVPARGSVMVVPPAGAG
jgi:hypothetical protein